MNTKANEGFSVENCTLHTLSNYTVLIETAVKAGYIGVEEMDTLKKWRADPSGWGEVKSLS
jgi:orotate phosphoribosyltransferase